MSEAMSMGLDYLYSKLAQYSLLAGRYAHRSPRSLGLTSALRALLAISLAPFLCLPSLSSCILAFFRLSALSFIWADLESRGVGVLSGVGTRRFPRC